MGKRILFSLVLLTISGAMALCIGELFVRIVSPQPVSWLAVYRQHPELPFFSMLPNQLLHVDTGETNWTVKTDEQGFRIPLEARPTASCQTLWLGDSFAFGHGVNYRDSFIGQIEKQTPGTGHINSSVSGYGPVQYRETLEYLARNRLAFDRIIVSSYVGNDFHDTLWDKTGVVEDGIIGNKGGLKSFLKRNFHTYRLVTAAYHTLAGDNEREHDTVSDQLANPEAWQGEFLSGASQRYAEEMRAIFDFGRLHNKPVSFLVLPTREAAGETFSRSQGMTPKAEDHRQQMLPVQRARAILDEMGADYVDLTSVVGAQAPEEVFFRFDGHFKPDANGRVAQTILEVVSFDCAGSGVDPVPDLDGR